MGGLQVLLWLLFPFAVGYGLRAAIVAKSDWGRASLASLAAALPSFGILAMPGDGITNAAGWAISPVLFLMFLFPAGFGVHLASLREIK